MQSDLFSSIGAIFKRTGSIFLPAAIVPALLVLSVLSSGCAEKIKPASEQTILALSILGTDAPVLGGLNALDGLQAFTAALDNETSLKSQDRLDEILEELGIDTSDESLSIYYNIRDISSSGVANAVVFAPISEEMLQSFSNEATAMQRFGKSGHNHTTTNQGLFVSLIEEGMTLVSSSRDGLELMHARAHGVDTETGERVTVEFSDLIHLASDHQFWIASESVQSLIREIPINTSVKEIQLLAKAISGVALTFNVDSENGDSPSVTGKILLSAREGIETSDIADLVGGLIAMGKIQFDGSEGMIKLFDRFDVSKIDLSDRGSVVQIAFRISVDDIRSLQRDMELQFSH